MADVTALPVLAATPRTPRRGSTAEQAGAIDRTAEARRPSTLAAVEAELRRIRWAVHDRTLQRQGALGWWAERALGPDGETVAAEARAIADELRAIALGAGPDEHMPQDLAIALRALVEDEPGHGGPRLRLVLRGGADAAFPAEVAAAAYHVAREAIGNALRHSSASLIVVAAHLDVATLRVEVTDDGVGIDEVARRRALERGRTGLGVMSERASAAGARFDLVTDARGTRITFDWRR